MIGQINFLDELIVDSFAGGGGASTGIELALGRPVDIAINHDINAIRMHEANHPYTKHYCENIFEVNPLEATQGRKVGLLWASPDCTHFSKAKGGKPVKKEIRGLAWVILKWASQAKPRVIILENVPEFQTWGPIDKEGKPIKARRGETFNQFVRHLRNLGYIVECRVLSADDYGAGTSRKRLYLIARCDGKPIVFPNSTHGDGLKPKHTAAEYIDSSIRGKSIFNRKKPLAEATLRRIARGLDKFTIKSKKPFIIPVGYGEHTKQAPRINDIGSPLNNHGTSLHEPIQTSTAVNNSYLTSSNLIQYHAETNDGETRAYGLDEPIKVIDTQPRYGLSTAHLVNYYSTGDALDAEKPLPTQTTKDRAALVENHLCVLRNNMDCKPINKPIPTITTSPGHFANIKTYLIKYDKNANILNWEQVRDLLNQYAGYSITDDEILILEINGIQYFIGDIEMRMLLPKELYGCQGFPKDYIFEYVRINGKLVALSKTEQVKKVGNSVCPPMAQMLVKHNLPELAHKKQLTTMTELKSVICSRGEKWKNKTKQ